VHKRCGKNPDRTVTPDELGKLLSATPISDREPWCNGHGAIDAWYRELCDLILRQTASQARIAWDCYGCGYASFVDAWFYRPTREFRLKGPYRRTEYYCGLVVLLCRLAPVYALAEGDKFWDAKGSGGYLPSFESLDDIRTPAVRELAAQVGPILDAAGLKRMRQADLSAPLPPETRIDTNLGDEPFRAFDAYFYWYD
jgi:hypothetical protein